MAVSVCSSRFFALNRQFVIKVLCVQQKVFVSNSKIEEIKSEAQKKPKRPIIPKITLISADNVSVTTLEEAQKLSKRRDLKLVKIIDVDTKTQRPVYKLMTGSEYHGEELKQREEKKKEKSKENAIKGEKVLMLSAGIGVNDLKVTANKIMKWMSKRYEARIIINGSSENMEKAVSF